MTPAKLPPLPPDQRVPVDTPDALYVEYRTLDELLALGAKRNPKDHDIGQIDSSMNRFGYTLPPMLDERSGRLVAGHGRLETLAGKRERGETPPKRVIERESDGEWLVPLYRGIAFNSDAEAEAYLLADNRLTELGGWHDAGLVDVMSDWTSEQYVGTGFDEGDLDNARRNMDPYTHGDLPKRQPNRRTLPLDVIYTLQGADCTCCLAVQAGLRYGVQSGAYRLCPYTHELSGRHEVAFVDNDYFDYDHGKHLAVVEKLRPKYATVRDVMDRGQCKTASIEYYDLDRILVWAEQLEEFAERVIVIPKYDCIDEIPEQYVLGYSLPTSHGGTELPVDRFKGRAAGVHILGGSWKNQLYALAALGDDAVSLDNNYVAATARQYGQFTDPDGETRSLTDAGFSMLNNVQYSALALTFGAIGYKLHELGANPIQEEAQDARH